MVSMPDMKNLAEGFGAIFPVFGKVLGKCDGIGEFAPQMTPQTVEPCRGGVRSQHQGEARGRTNCLITVSEIEAHSTLRESIKVWRDRMRIAVSPDRGLEVIDKNEKHIGRACFCANHPQKTKQVSEHYLCRDHSGDDLLNNFCRAFVGTKLGLGAGGVNEGVVEVESLRIYIENSSGFEAAAIGRGGVENAGELSLGVVVPTIAGLGGDGEKEVVEKGLAVSFAGIVGIQELEEVGELAHFEVSVGAELLVLFVLAELVPPFVGAAFIAGGVELGGVIEVVDFFTVEVVVAFEANALASREEGEGAEAGAVGLDGERIELGHESPFAGEFFDCDIDALSSGVGLSAVRELGGRWLVRGVFVDLELERALLVFADAVEVVLESPL